MVFKSASMQWMVLTAILVMVGCGTKPDIVSKKPKPGQTYSADEIRRMSVDQPFTLSGDYFRERNEAGKPIDELLSRKRKSTADVSEKDTSKQPPQKTPQISSADTASPESNRSIVAAAKQPEAVHHQKKFSEKASEDIPQNIEGMKNGLPVKIGVIVDTENIPDADADRLTNSMKAAAGAFPAIIARSDLVNEVMTRANCAKQRDLACLSGALAVYPGVRMVILAEALALPAQVPGNVSARVSVVDTGLLFRYPVMEISAPVGRSADAQQAITGICAKAIDFAVKRSKLMPWYCRAFSNEAGEWYITAGRKSGLMPGQELQVIQKGRLVKSPTGFPAGWIPGEAIGRLKVVQPFGEDFAVCKLIEGDGPEQEHFLIPAEPDTPSK